MRRWSTNASWLSWATRLTYQKRLNELAQQADKFCSSKARKAGRNHAKAGASLTVRRSGKSEEQRLQDVYGDNPLR